MNDDIISRLSRKLQKAVKQNSELRKYTQHKKECKANNNEKCNCGLDKLINIKRQEPI